jgi:hypothetical protein
MMLHVGERLMLIKWMMLHVGDKIDVDEVNDVTCRW